MTVAELNASMSVEEYQQWQAFFVWRNAMEEQEMEQAKAEAAVRRR